MRDVPAYVNMALGALEAAGYQAYLVGGCVRDRLMGRTPSDWDVCTSALPEQTAGVFAGRFRLIETGMRHGTVTVLTDGGPVEITTFRADGAYSDNRRPDAVTFVPGLEADLARRDFTVNAMALGSAGDVIDLYGGREDLAAGLIRAVGEPEKRFAEDALRILRALRFASRLDFVIEPATARAAVESRIRLRNIAWERIFSELKGILTGPGAGRVLREYAPIIFQIIPELAPQAGFEQRNPHHIHDVWTHTAMAVDAAPADTVLRLTMLLHDVGKPQTFFIDGNGVGHFYGHGEAGARAADGILRRLRCDNATRAAVTELIAAHDAAPPRTEKAMRRLLARFGEEGVRRLIACWRADSADRAPAVRAENGALIDGAQRILDAILAEKEPCFDLKSLAVNGRDILALGLAQGPGVGRVLDALFRQVLDGALPNERQALLARARTLINRDCQAEEKELQ